MSLYNIVIEIAEFICHFAYILYKLSTTVESKLVECLESDYLSLACHKHVIQSFITFKLLFS